MLFASKYVIIIVRHVTCHSNMAAVIERPFDLSKLIYVHCMAMRTGSIKLDMNWHQS